MVAHDPISGNTSTPTTVKVDRKTDKDGNTTSKTVEYPLDPQIQLQGEATGPRPQTQHSGFAQGGTTNPPVGETGDPTWYDPDGNAEETPEAMFERDAEVNPRGDGHGRKTRFADEFGTADDPAYVPAKGQPDAKGS